MSELVDSRCFRVHFKIKNIEKIDDSKDVVFTEDFINQRAKRVGSFYSCLDKGVGLMFHNTLIPNHYVSVDFCLEQIDSMDDSLAPMLRDDISKSIFSWKAKDE